MFGSRIPACILIQGFAAALFLWGPVSGSESMGQCTEANHLEIWCSGCNRVGPQWWSSTHWQCQYWGETYEWFPLSDYWGNDEEECELHASECPDGGGMN
jgi:hypothetical protein